MKFELERYTEHPHRNVDAYISDDGTIVGIVGVTVSGNSGAWANTRVKTTSYGYVSEANTIVRGNDGDILSRERANFSPKGLEISPDVAAFAIAAAELHHQVD